MRGRAPNIGIVTSYNDMLSAHQPFKDYPDMIKDAARKAGATAQVAGGTPAMCDGVTQGRPGMELSLFSRDVIAMASAVGLSHDTFDAALHLGVCDKIVPGLVIEGLAVTLPREVRATRITLADEGSLWLEVTAPRIAFDLQALWQREAHLQEVTAERITLHRRPDVQATAQGVNAVTQLREQKHRTAAALAAVAVTQIGPRAIQQARLEA
jgi:hypothetical protein